MMICAVQQYFFEIPDYGKSRRPDFHFAVHPELGEGELARGPTGDAGDWEGPIRSYEPLERAAVRCIT